MTRQGFGGLSDLFPAKTLKAAAGRALPVCALALTVGFAAAAGPAAATQDRYGPSRDGGLYVEPKAGVTFFDIDLNEDFLDTDTDPGFVLGGAVGLKDDRSGLRGEAEILYSRAGFKELSDSHIDVTTFGVNGYYDFDGGPIKPYIGAGVGVARVNVDIDFIANDEEYAVTYNGQAGVNFDLEGGSQLHAGYRYTGVGDTEINGLFGDLEVASHTVEAGYRLPF